MIGERLSDIRKDHKETQADLAKYLGVSLATVRAWEQEKSSPGHEMLISICKRYKVSSDYLLGLSDIDPAYVQFRQTELLSAEELCEIKKYEEYLIWRRKSR